MRSTHPSGYWFAAVARVTEASPFETAEIVRITVVVDHRVAGSGQERTHPPNDQRSDRERRNEQELPLSGHVRRCETAANERCARE